MFTVYSNLGAKNSNSEVNSEAENSEVEKSEVEKSETDKSEAENSEADNYDGDNSDGDGYETDSNRSYFEENVESLVHHPVRDIPEIYLRRFIQETEGIKREHIDDANKNPEEEYEEEDLLQEFTERNQALRDELRRRKDAGMVADSSDDEDVRQRTSQYGNPGENQGEYQGENKGEGQGEGEGSRKRKFEEDNDDAHQSSNKVKDHSSDMTGNRDPQGENYSNRSSDNGSINKNSSQSENNNPDKQSPMDFVLEKQQCELPDIPDSDGGGD